MAEYQLTETNVVIRNSDKASIPDDPANRDRAEYEQWLADGGVPDPAVPLPTAPAAGEMLYDHENRLRALEGQPLLERSEFKA